MRGRGYGRCLHAGGPPNTTYSEITGAVALTLVFEIGGMAFPIGKFTLGGIGLAGITGVVLNRVQSRPHTQGRRQTSGGKRRRAAKTDKGVPRYTLR